jgi:hypothetical protein
VTTPSDRDLVFEDHFDGTGLDVAAWVPSYLPAWSSRAASAAAHTVHDSCLHLTIPADHPVWCEGDHEPPIRVSGIQSGSWSGPVGSTRGQQPFRPGQTVREEQPAHWGFTPDRGWVGLRARATISPRSMVSLWMVGRETVPQECAEICVMEVFGDAVERGPSGASAAVGSGLHAFRDPDVAEDFAAPRLRLDPADWHVYAVDWTPDRAVFMVDGQVTRTCARPPAYPLQLMLAVFDFPDRSGGSDGPDADVDPELVIDWVRGYA